MSWGLIAYMKDYLEIEYMKNKAMKKYTNSCSTIPDLNKLDKEEKSKIRSNQLTLKPYGTGMIFKPGEQKLLFLKEYENGALTEDDTCLPDSNIDGIIKNMNSDIPIALRMQN
ncbi:hypothetical protein BDB01DRAFT_847498 [Pilobolus umbonatus]|nr:hypothetical protein BDB01DRAFT_847498 [Pilobolus umbonatus]